jgi:hypothetical protein
VTSVARIDPFNAGCSTGSPQAAIERPLSGYAGWHQSSNPSQPLRLHSCEPIPVTEEYWEEKTSELSEQLGKATCGILDFGSRPFEMRPSVVAVTTIDLAFT